MTELISNVAAALEKRGFQVLHAATKEDATRQLLELIPGGSSVGAGGSMTIRELGVTDALQSAGCTIAWHWLPGTPASEAFPAAHAADFYLCSANAVTRDGQLVNIDGTGNRVAAMIHGPKHVIAVVGCNKLVDGGYPQALARIKRDACPPNARRLNLPFPCGLTGKCSPADCPGGFCNIITIQEHPTGKRPYTVILLDEPLGY